MSTPKQIYPYDHQGPSYGECVLIGGLAARPDRGRSFIGIDHIAFAAVRDIEQQFDVVDNKGRRMGARVTTYDNQFVAVARTDRDGDDTAADYRAQGQIVRNAVPGVYYAYVPGATREGHRFGASQDARYYATAQERDEAVRIYFNNARKRAQAMVGKDGFTNTQEIDK